MENAKVTLNPKTDRGILTESVTVTISLEDWSVIHTLLGVAGGPIWNRVALPVFHALEADDPDGHKAICRVRDHTGTGKVGPRAARYFQEHN